MYIRFATPGGLGLFHAVGELRDDPARWRRLARREQAGLLALRRQLWEITPAPPEEAYDDPRHPLPRTWFREDAARHVDLAWQVYRLAQGAGSRVRPVRAHNPGLVLWSDEVQAVVRAPAVRVQWVRKPPRALRWDGSRESIRAGL